MCNEEGIYVSQYCQQNGFNECALMITGFPGKYERYLKRIIVPIKLVILQKKHMSN